MPFIDPYPEHLRHPDLRSMDRGDFIRRSHWMSKWWYPSETQIGWFGNAVRDTDGGQGMYCTQPQYEAWPHKVFGDLKIGPS